MPRDTCCCGYAYTVEPIPETSEALRMLELGGDDELREDLQRLATRAKSRVPGLVGVSVGLVSQDLVLTYLASDVEAAALDAVQYTDDGPCLEAVREGEIVQTGDEYALDEGRWQLFAQAGAAAGVRSSLSIPFRHDGVVTGGVNLYGATSDTFDGLVDQLSAIFGAWAPGAVTNADLSFDTRLEAMEAPKRLKDQQYVDKAIGLLMAVRSVSVAAAEDSIRVAAARAGVTMGVLSKAIVEAFSWAE